MVMLRGSRSLQLGRAPAGSMGSMWMSVMLLILAAVLLSGVQAKVYMVLMDDSPVVHYDGSIPGYVATAAAVDTKVDGTSLAVQKYADYLRTTHDEMLANTLPEGAYTKLYSYTFVVNGFAVDFPEEQAAGLAGLETHPSVKKMEADRKVIKATTHTPDYLGLPDGAWLQFSGGVTSAGEDIVIGVVDTGINPAHPSFANDEKKPYGPLSSYTGTCEVAEEFPLGSCNYKLIGARHFSAAAEAGGVFNATEDFASPLDGDGHGTHTASTAGGNHGVSVEVDGLYFGEASGMAPRARIAVYKALYRQFGGFFADVVAAIDQAVADGVDILSLSIAPGGPSGINAVYFDIFDVALLGAVRAGVFVAQAAGNGGPFMESIESWSPWIVSVAASSDDRNYTNSLTLGNGKTFTGYGLADGTPGSGLYNIVQATDVNVTYSPNITIPECQSSDYYDKKLVEGNLLVCTYDFDFLFGIATFEAVSATAKNLSAAGVIYVVASYLEDAELTPTVISTNGIPAIVITDAVSIVEFYSYYNASTLKAGADSRFGAQAKLNGGLQTIFTGAPPVVASFSSRGPDYNNISLIPADVLKPNIMAPGVSIWAAWSPIGLDEVDFEGANFALISGTSMATPHIAGIAALVKEKNPTFSPAAIHSALAGTAYSYDKTGAPLQAQYPSANMSALLGPASAFDMGAGQVDPQAALDPGLIFEAGIEDYVKFLCHVPTANASEVFDATGSGCDHVGAGYSSDLNTPYIAVGVLQGSRVVPRTVTNVCDVSEDYTVELVSPSNVTGAVAPTFFSIYPGESQYLTVNLTAQTTSNTSTFGTLRFYGNGGHFISIPITVGQLIWEPY